MKDPMRDVVVIVPVYQVSLTPLEAYSLDRSMATLRGRDIVFIGPEGLDLAYYRARYGDLVYRAYPKVNFASIPGYNRLLLSQAFYRDFAGYEFSLICQTDAIALRDELDDWCSKPFDYVGAPWPDGFSLMVNAGPFEGANGKLVRVMVGNGGFSLRRNRKAIALLDEFAAILNVFLQTGSSEDLFFSVMGALSQDFLVPNEITASRFSVELRPSHYYAVNGGHLPMGTHAWWKSEPEFWRPQLPGAPLPAKA
jgi:hypothetical protein